MSNIQMLEKEGTLYEIDFYYKLADKYYHISIKDSYKHLSYKLSDIAKIFKMDVKKEVMPYDLYTFENLEKRYVDIDEVNKYLS